MSLDSDMGFPEFIVLPNKGLCWPEQKMSRLAKGSKGMSLSQYEELKGLPTSNVFKQWVEENKIHERSLEIMLDIYGKFLLDIATANNFDGDPGLVLH